MATHDKVISLEQRRAAGQARHREARAEHQARAAEAADAQRQADAAAAADPTPVPGRLIWLYCPTCRTIEYTEVDVSGGRVHNTCGSQVHEAPVELDLRAEATIAAINLERLDILHSLLDGQRKRFDEYLRRLNLAAGRSLAPYALGERGAETLPVADVDAFGLLVSQFFSDPGRLFPGLATPAAVADAPTAAGAPTTADAAPSVDAPADADTPGNVRKD